MNYQESREYIDKITREIPSVLGLDHMRELMKRLGNPQDDRLPCILTEAGWKFREAGSAERTLLLILHRCLMLLLL